MVAPSICDIMSSSDDAEHCRGLARRLIESILLDRTEIEKFDDVLSPDDPLQFDRESASVIRQMYEQWCHDADALLARIGEVERRFGSIAGSDELRRLFGTTMAMLSISLDHMESATQDILKGRLHSAEEVRRELQLRTH